MDINKLTSHINGSLNGSDPAKEGAKTEEPLFDRSPNGISDKVSIAQESVADNEELFARIELEKLNQSSFDKLKQMKAKISEYEAAKEISDEAAAQTEIGQMLNNPDVWGEIAGKLID